MLINVNKTSGDQDSEQVANNLKNALNTNNPEQVATALNSVTSLQIEGMPYEIDQIQTPDEKLPLLLGVLRENTSITSLEFDAVRFDVSRVNLLISSLENNKSIEDLSLDWVEADAKTTRECTKGIAKLPDTSAIKRLSMNCFLGGRKSMDQETAKAFALLIKREKITDFSFECNNIDDEVAAHPILSAMNERKPPLKVNLDNNDLNGMEGDIINFINNQGNAGKNISVGIESGGNDGINGHLDKIDEAQERKRDDDHNVAGAQPDAEQEASWVAQAPKRPRLASGDSEELKKEFRSMAL